MCGRSVYSSLICKNMLKSGWNTKICGIYSEEYNICFYKHIYTACLLILSSIKISYRIKFWGSITVQLSHSEEVGKIVSLLLCFCNLLQNLFYASIYQMKHTAEFPIKAFVSPVMPVLSKQQRIGALQWYYGSNSVVTAQRHFYQAANVSLYLALLLESPRCTNTEEVPFSFKLSSTKIEISEAISFLLSQDLKSSFQTYFETQMLQEELRQWNCFARFQVSTHDLFSMASKLYTAQNIRRHWGEHFKGQSASFPIQAYPI